MKDTIDYLFETIRELSNNEEGEKYVNTLNIVANLLYEMQTEQRWTAAKYDRVINLGRLSLEIKLRNSYEKNRS